MYYRFLGVSKAVTWQRDRDIFPDVLTLPPAASSAAAFDVITFQGIFWSYRGNQRFYFSRLSFHRIQQTQANQLFLAIFQNDVVVAINQVITTTGQTAPSGPLRPG